MINHPISEYVSNITRSSIYQTVMPDIYAYIEIRDISIVFSSAIKSFRTTIHLGVFWSKELLSSERAYGKRKRNQIYKLKKNIYITQFFREPTRATGKDTL